MQTRPATRNPDRGRHAWAYTPAQQARAEQTVERIVSATESLLRSTPFEEIKIRDIVAKAGTNTGSFYARFATKDALLPYLYERYDRDLDKRFGEWHASTPWHDLTLEQASHATAQVVVRAYRERKWLLRTMAMFARAHPDALPPEVHERRKRTHQRALVAFARHHGRIAHPQAERAVLFGIFLISSAARELLLFENAPHARTVSSDTTGLESQLGAALFGYLTTAPGGGTSTR